MKNNSVVTALGQRSPSARAVAYFRSSSQEGHEYAISSQKDQVRRWAHDHGFEIIREFCDVSPSETEPQARPDVTEMLEEWIKQRSDFEYVLCFDASRLGRFPVSGRLAELVEMIDQYKKQLIFTSMDKQQTRLVKTA